MSANTDRNKLVSTRLTALVIGIALAALVIVGIYISTPVQSTHAQDMEYGYVYSGAKSSSVEFVGSTNDRDSLYIFGSSEFSTPSSLVEQVPANTFATHDYGVHMQLIGEAYDQSLWHTMALGAFAAHDVPQNKIVISVSLGWFVDGGLDNETFETRFSYSLYRAFCQNPKVPQACKDYVEKRLIECGIDANAVNAPTHELPQDFANDFAYAAVDDLHLRSGLNDVRTSGVPAVRLETPETPDFAAMRENAYADAQSHSTNNDWGVEDAFYAQQLGPALDGAQGARTAETYSQTPEYDDLSCLLDVANACGLDALVVISPVLGPYYDYIGIDADKRRGCYDRVRNICAEHGVSVADFTDKEYEKYFLFDIVHYGWTGWVDVEQSIYEFARR